MSAGSLKEKWGAKIAGTATAVGFGGRPEPFVPSSRRRRSPTAKRSSPPAQQPSPSRPKPPVQIINFRMVVKGALRGFSSVRWNAAGRVLRSCGVYVAADDGAWVGLLAAPVIDCTGKHRRQYRPTVEWRDRRFSDRFSKRVIELLLLLLLQKFRTELNAEVAK